MRYYTLFVEPFMMQSLAFGSGIVYNTSPTPRRRQGILRLLCGYFLLQVGSIHIREGAWGKGFFPISP